MFGHDKEDKKEDNVIHPISTKPVDEKLMGLDDDSSTDSSNASDDNKDKDIENLVEDINASTSATVTSSNSDDDKTSSDDLIVPPSESDSVITQSEESTTSSDDSSSTPPSSDLMDIKRSALEELSPLIDKLDQTPEEKTMTLLMMIQATDDQSLIGTVFNVAKDIKDDKKRAQAMLDIVNEINYFTSKKK